MAHVWHLQSLPGPCHRYKSHICLCKIGQWACNCAAQPLKTPFRAVCQLRQRHPHVLRFAVGRKRNPPLLHKGAVELWGEGYFTLMTTAFSMVSTTSVSSSHKAQGSTGLFLGRSEDLLCSHQNPISLYIADSTSLTRGFLHPQHMAQHLPHNDQLLH